MGGLNLRAPLERLLESARHEETHERPRPGGPNSLHKEAIVDANGPEEQVMGWYYYFDDEIRFPFQAKCIAPKVVSPFRKGETVEVQGMAPEDACSADMSSGNLSFTLSTIWKTTKLEVIAHTTAQMKAVIPMMPSAAKS
jgi:hypothetical protein